MKASLARSAYVVALVLVVGYALITLRGPHGISALMDKQQQVHQLEKRNGALAQEIERKKERIKRLEDSASDQELEIRERLKLVHPDEKVYILGDPAKR
jgi:cell division protein FtsB